MEHIQDTHNTHELLQAEDELWHQSIAYVRSMALKCAMDMQILDIIHNHGGPITLSELAKKIGLHPSKVPRLRRIMRVLTISHMFVIHEPASANKEVSYGLSPASRLLVKDESSSNLFPTMSLFLDSTIIVSLLGLHPWFLDEHPTSLFKRAHGRTFWEMADQDNNYGKLVNYAMVYDSHFLMDIALRESSGIFRGIKALIDVGGGLGGASMAITKAFPHIKCTVLDRPPVVAQAPTDGNVKFVPGDMFEYVPPADVVLLKWVLHDWGDEQCIKILKKCKEAIPPREAGGKIIIIDMVVGSESRDHTSKDTQVLFDLLMMFIEGVEREEREWKKIFIEAGFSDYKITPVLGVRSIIELYP